MVDDVLYIGITTGLQHIITIPKIPFQGYFLHKHFGADLFGNINVKHIQIPYRYPFHFNCPGGSWRIFFILHQEIAIAITVDQDPQGSFPGLQALDRKLFPEQVQ